MTNYEYHVSYQFSRAFDSGFGMCMITLENGVQEFADVEKMARLIEGLNPGMRVIIISYNLLRIVVKE